jgi:multiple sugar transport system permease protein
MATDVRSGSLSVAAARTEATAERADRPAAASDDHRRTPRAGRVAVVAALAVFAVLFTYPFFWLVSASLKPRSQVFDNKLLPERLVPHNYVEVWQAAPVWTWLINTVVVGLAAAAAVTVSSALVAFGFAYFRFPGRGVLFGLVLGSMMLPGVVTIVPVYLVWNAAGLVGSQIPLWAGNLFGSAFYIFLLRQFFLGLPRDVFEAARVDGLGYFGLFWRMALPLSKPALIITFVFELRSSWTDLVKPLVYLQDPKLYTLPRGLKAVLDQFGKGGESQWEVVLAASVIATIPMVVVFLVAQRYFVQGISTTGRTG